MLNIAGRLQRLNRAVPPKDSCKDDWEILRDLRLEVTGGNGISTFEELFKSMAAATPEFAGLTFSKVGDLGTLIETNLVPKTDAPTPAAKLSS